MERIQWRDVAEAIGIIALVASLIFVGIQLRLEQEIAESQAYIDAAAASYDLAELITNNQDIWIIGLDGSELSTSDQVKFDTIVWAVSQRKIAIWQRRIRLDAGDPDSWISSFAYELYLYPGLRESWARLSARRSFDIAATGADDSNTGFSGQVQRVLAELDRTAPEKPPERSYNLR